MEILEFRKKDTYILGLHGKLDAASSPHFRDKFFGLIDEGETHFLIDCSQLEYVSSAGLRVFFEAAYKIEDLSGRMVFCSLSSNVKKVFDMVELSSELPVYPSQEVAFKEMEEERAASTDE